MIISDNDWNVAPQAPFEFPWKYIVELDCSLSWWTDDDVIDGNNDGDNDEDNADEDGDYDHDENDYLMMMVTLIAPSFLWISVLLFVLM